MSILKVTIVLTIASFTLGILFGNALFKPTDKQQEILDSHEKIETKWQIKYQKLLKTKKIIIPVCKTIECEHELDLCLNKLDEIKHWCDPYCKQELSECTEALQLTQESNLNTYYHYGWRP